jgi:hypothetical protein
MDTNWYMKKQLVNERLNTLLAAAESQRLRREARHPGRAPLTPRAPKLPAWRSAGRRAVVVPCTPTWHP